MILKHFPWHWGASTCMYIIWSMSVHPWSNLYMPRNPGSSVGLVLAYWSSGPEFEPCSRWNLLNCKRIPLHTAFHYQRFIILIWLKDVKIRSHPSIHPWIISQDTQVQTDSVNPYICIMWSMSVHPWSNLYIANDNSYSKFLSPWKTLFSAALVREQHEENEFFRGHQFFWFF